MESLDKRLKRLREKKGITVKQLCQEIGIPVTTYREWEYGRAITGEPYVALAQVLGVSVYELLTGKAPQSQLLNGLIEIEYKLTELKKNAESFF